MISNTFFDASIDNRSIRTFKNTGGGGSIVPQNLLTLNQEPHSAYDFDMGIEAISKRKFSLASDVHNMHRRYQTRQTGRKLKNTDLETINGADSTYDLPAS